MVRNRPLAPVSLAEFRVLPSAPHAVSVRQERIEPQISDEELVARLVDGDVWAQEALYRRYVRLVWGTALRLVGSRADAEDVVQDTFTAALHDLPGLERGGALRSWLMQIAVHQAHRRFRRRSVLRKLGLDRSLDDASLSALVHPAASPETLAELSRIDRALKHLRAEERFAWILRYVDGHTLEEAATACRCSLATLKRRLAKANACLQRHERTGAGDD